MYILSAECVYVKINHQHTFGAVSASSPGNMESSSSPRVTVAASRRGGEFGVRSPHFHPRKCVVRRASIRLRTRGIDRPHRFCRLPDISTSTRAERDARSRRDTANSCCPSC
ncbi:hypothetical protein CDAR_308681 [Caerostris darwini]|uniref:Uncharacterized protein n=1 Tax=Caerostris darwini TaxID=1538125 RepID=A0AAV4NUT7_9ARAC|nr:hypothetical protein CDAR_308681 [Caerostris darwini]